MRKSARLLAGAVLALTACTSPPRSTYVPGGAELPDAARLEYRRAVAKENQGDPRAALAILDDLVTAYPLRLGIHLHRLRLARDLEGPDFAARLYQPPPPGVDPERAAVLAKLARLPHDDVAEREAVLEAAAAREPFEPFWRLGIAYVKLSSFDLVAERARRERELGRVQTAAESFAEAARIVEDARREAETALQHDGNLKEAHLLLGFLATRRAELVATREESDSWRRLAEHHYVEARSLDPGCVSTRLNLAENYLYFGAYSEAARELAVAVELAPAEPRAWNNLGLTYYSTGRVDEAIACYREALELEPDSARTRAALSDCLRLTDPEAALAELARADEDAGDDRELRAEIAFKMGAIHEHERRYKAAIEAYERHVELGGADASKAESRIRHIYAGR